MGANAQTEVPAFIAGQVLTAVQQTQINTGVPVFATTVTRDAAFGGAGEKALAEGQFAYIEATNTTQYYDGATWQTVGVTPGLVCVKAETAFTAASSITADNVFSATYTNYQILVNYTTTGAAGLDLRFRVGGVSTSTGTYNTQKTEFDNTTATLSRATAATSLSISGGSNGSFNSTIQLIINNPFVATPTTLISTNEYNYGAYSGVGIKMNYGNQTGSTSFDGIEILTSIGTTTGTYTIYGFSKAV